MNNILKLWIFIFILFSNFLAFADDGPGDTSDNGLENDDTPAAPINAKLIWLGILGVLFAWYMYKQRRLKTQQ
jgi:hypothetical protein